MVDKYISVGGGSAKKFANIGFFAGLSSAVLSAVYSLILFQVFKSDVLVGLYSSLFAVVGLICTLFSSELFRIFNKTQLYLFGVIIVILTSFGMSFPVSIGSFITLDIARGISLIVMGMSISLFMVEFSNRQTLAKFSGRYVFLNNMGALIGPVLGAYFASKYDNLFPLKIVSLIYLFTCFYFISQHLKAEEKNLRPKRIISIWIKIFKNVKRFVLRPDLRAVYMTSFGYYGIQSLRSLYVPLAIVNAGFSKDTIGMVLSLGVIPFVLFSSMIANLSVKYGVKKFFIYGYLSFAIFALFASISSGVMLLSLFILWQIPNAVIEPILDIPFFKTLSDADYGRFFTIFRTASRIAKIILPLFAALFISLFGGINGVWILASLIALISMYYAKKIVK